MQIKKIDTTKIEDDTKFFRPMNFEDFLGQEEIKKILKAGIQSAQKRESFLGHILFSGESGYGKTTLAQIIARNLWVNIKIITGYAITKPAEMISILNSLEDGDVLFIDEIHRLRPNLEEVLYIAMEDFMIDMVLPEWGNVRIPLNKFTLVGATTKLESLSLPLKNRFVYKFHFVDYEETEKMRIIERYLKFYDIGFEKNIVSEISANIISVPREINNFCFKLRDYLICKWAKQNNLLLDKEIREEFREWAKLIDGGLTHVHQKYIEILQEVGGGPVWLKTISLRLGMNEAAVEDDIEPLLLKLGKIEKSSRWRTLIK